MRLVPSATEPTKRKIYHGLGRDHSGSVDIGIDEKKVKKNKEGDYRGLGISLNHSMGSDKGVGAGDRVDKSIMAITTIMKNFEFFWRKNCGVQKVLKKKEFITFQDS